MLKKLYALKNKKGFTLVELMVVVAILGILVAVAVPVYNNVTDRAAIQVDESNARTLTSSLSQLSTLNGGTLATAATVGATSGTAVATDLTLEDDTIFFDGAAGVKLVPNYIAEFPAIKSDKYKGYDFVYKVDTKTVELVKSAG